MKRHEFTLKLTAGALTSRGHAALHAAGCICVDGTNATFRRYAETPAKAIAAVIAELKQQGIDSTDNTDAEKSVRNYYQSVLYDICDTIDRLDDSHLNEETATDAQIRVRRLINEFRWLKHRNEELEKRLATFRSLFAPREGAH